jgi:hypothetical protein
LIIDSHYYFQMPHTPLLMPLLLPAIWYIECFHYCHCFRHYWYAMPRH